MKDLTRWKQITNPQTKKAALSAINNALFRKAENIAVMRAARHIGADGWDGKNKKELNEFCRQFSSGSEKLPSWKKLDSAGYSLWLDKNAGAVRVVVELEYKLWERTDEINTCEFGGFAEIKLSRIPGAESIFLLQQNGQK